MSLKKKKQAHDLKQNRKENLILLLNPKNLEKEVNQLGYNFSLTNHVLTLVLSGAGCIAIGYVFQLKIEFVLALIGVIFLFIPNEQVKIKKEEE